MNHDVEAELKDGLPVIAFNYRIQAAKKEETRAARIEKFVVMLNEGKALY